MHKNILRYTPYVAMALFAAFVLCEVGNLGVGLGPTFLMILAVPCVLYALGRFPSAFIVPVLFMPQEKSLPLIPIRSQGGVTALFMAVVLLCVAIVIRFAVLSSRKPSGLRELFRGSKRGIITYGLFAAVVAVSYMYTRAPEYGGDKLLRFLTIGSLCFIAPFVLLREEEDFRHCALATVALGAIMGVVQLLSTSHGSFAKGETVVHIGIAQLIGMAILLVLNFKFFDSRLARFLIWLVVPLLVVGLIASEARGPLFSLLLVTSLFSFVHPPNTKPLNTYRILTLGAVLGLAAIVMAPPSWLQGKAASRLEYKKQELVKLVEGEDSKGSGGRRLDFYKSAMLGMAQKPVLGWGVGGWSTYYFYTDFRHYPHNIIFEVGVEQGLLGIGALLAFLLTAFGAARKVFLDGGDKYAFLLPMLIYSLGVTMTSGDVDDNRFLWFWCGAALAIYGLMKSESQEVEASEALGS